ncbi:MAG TPA: hypothetical protein VFX61_05900 [Micromonosporaceae bacterium]|nr:hypothetical protein [Micromonosporaceae bacterium]
MDQGAVRETVTEQCKEGRSVTRQRSPSPPWVGEVNNATKFITTQLLSEGF